VNTQHREQVRRLARQLQGVTLLPLSRELLGAVHLHANNRHYGFLMDLARLIAQCAIPDEAGGDLRFRNFLRDRQQMARLFEAFVFNFLRIERGDLTVRREVLAWDASSASDPELRFLPDMRTDVTARSGNKTVVIDAKYYEQTFTSYYDKRAIHGQHLYQLSAYLRNMEAREGPDAEAEGILLYPVVADDVDLEYRLLGHKLRIRTLNLDQDWQAIDRDLRTLLQ
jgi:5-methylcytosine-specific restriction enzyme subunit McrC